MLLIPYEIETLRDRPPWGNWLVVGLCSLVSFLALAGSLSEDTIYALVLDGWDPVGIFGHVLLHGGWVHLIGNMIFLWVFGNALCANTGNVPYLIIWLGCTLVAATVHVALDGQPAIGASGAINGITGFVLAMYPLNRVYTFWFFFVRGGTFSCRAYSIILLFLVFDIWGLAMGGDLVAYWAHIGGLAGGVGLGLLAMQRDWIQLTEFDNRSLLEILKGEHPDL